MSEQTTTPDPARDDPMLSGWDLVRHRATEALDRGHREFERSEHAASRSDFQVEELLNAGLLRAATPVDVVAEVAWHVAQLRQDRAGLAPDDPRRSDGARAYQQGWRDAYDQVVADLTARAVQRAATPTTTLEV
jgi:hypothetical protein